MNHYFSDPRNVLHHLRGAMHYDFKTNTYSVWNGPPITFSKFRELRFDDAGMTNQDVAAWAERLRFPKLERLSFLNNNLTSACHEDCEKIRKDSPLLDVFLVPEAVNEEVNKAIFVYRTLKKIRENMNKDGYEIVLNFKEGGTGLAVSQRLLDRGESPTTPLQELIDTAHSAGRAYSATISKHREIPTTTKEDEM